MARIVPKQARAVYFLVRRIRKNGMRAAEIGVHRGETSLALLNHIPELFLYMVDPWQTFDETHSYWQSGDAMAHYSLAQQESCFEVAKSSTGFARERRCILRMESVAASRRIDDASLDFVFIDAEHTYPAVVSDILHWWPKLCAGGILCGHDYGTSHEVVEAVERFSQLLRLPVGVARATVWWIDKPADEC